MLSWKSTWCSWRALTARNNLRSSTSENYSLSDSKQFNIYIFTISLCYQKQTLLYQESLVWGLRNVKDLFLITLAASSKIHVHSPFPCHFPYIPPEFFFFSMDLKDLANVREKNSCFLGQTRKLFCIRYLRYLGVTTSNKQCFLLTFNFCNTPVYFLE